MIKVIFPYENFENDPYLKIKRKVPKVVPKTKLMQKKEAKII